MSKIYIYTLSSSENPENIKYIGQTKHCKYRKNQHIYNSKKKITLKGNWIKGVLNKGYDIVFNVIEECTEKNWQEREKFWIKYYKESGFNLKNMTEGGETSYIKGENHHQFGKIGKKNLSFKGKDYKEFFTKSFINAGNKKPVDMIDPETNLVIKSFPSANAAAIYLKGNRNNITAICRGDRKTYQGYIWKYSNKEYFPVKQYKDDVLINTFKDLKTASILTGINHTNIIRSTKTHLKAGGYKWKYTYDDN